VVRARLLIAVMIGLPDTAVAETGDNKGPSRPQVLQNEAPLAGRQRARWRPGRKRIEQGCPHPVGMEVSG